MDDPQVNKKMQDVVTLVVSDISSIRTGRATPAMVEDIAVLVYGGQQRLKIKELASIHATDVHTLLIEPWDKSIVGDIRKGIQAANVGLNPSIDADKIRISLPPLTTEDREKYVVLLSAKLENGRVMIRQIRGDVMKDIKDAFEKKELSEDEKFDSEKKLQEITDQYIQKINYLGEEKKKELLGM
jgi:ribosome recycling factor